MRLPLLGLFNFSVPPFIRESAHGDETSHSLKGWWLCLFDSAFSPKTEECLI